MRKNVNGLSMQWIEDWELWHHTWPTIPLLCSSIYLSFKESSCPNSSWALDFRFLQVPNAYLVLVRTQYMLILGVF